MIDPTKQRLGNYRLLHVLGKGSFADVYLGRHVYLKTEVAIKVLYGNLDEDAIEKFLKEASHLQDLEHPNIVRILDLGIDDSIPYLVMEYAPFGTLRTRHPLGERVPLPTIVSYVQQIAAALDYAHEQKLIHRDLKPENLLIASDSRILLSDFGVALALHHTDSGSIHSIGGTLAYMAPEQIRGKPRAASDQYALAVMVYEWLTGTRPFGGSAAELLGQHLFVEPPSISAQVADLPPSVEPVIMKAFSKDFHERFAHVSDFADLLARASQGEILSVPREMSIQEVHPDSEPSLLAPAHKAFFNLPARVSSLIGRDEELKAATVLLARPEIRLLTMLGPGGIGKTTLAIACVSEILPAFRDGTCFVELASLTDPDQVLPALIQTLGIKEQKDFPLITSLKQVLHDKHLLLVLDNFEQVLDAAPLLLDLLHSCPEPKMLVTSRAVLHLPGEHIFPVPPLALPDLKQARNADLASNASIALFVERAHALKPDFQLTEANAPILVKLCRQLDGLPLAIELAAARISHLTPQQLLTRLSRRLDLLAQKNKAVPERQQTIRQTIQWSYDLLKEDEQLLFRRLSVFAGGCTLSDLEAIYTLLGDDAFSVIDKVASLVDKSLLVQKIQDESEARLEQLEIVREFARELLMKKGELDSMRAAHARHYASHAPPPEPAQLGLASSARLVVLKRDYQNLLTALAYFLEQQDLAAALQLATGMGAVWFINGYGSEGQEEMARLLRGYQPDQATPLLWVLAFTLAGRIAINNTDSLEGQRYLRQGVGLARLQPDKRFLGLSLNMLAFVEADLGNFAESDALISESIQMLREIKEQSVLARATIVTSSTLLRRGLFDQVNQSVQEGIRLAREVGNLFWPLAVNLHVLGWMEYLNQNYLAAHTYGQESVELFRPLGFPALGLEALSTLAYETAALGDLAAAQILFGEHQTLSQEAGDTGEIGRAFCDQGYLALLRNDLAQARHQFEESIRILLQIKLLGTRFTHILASSLEGLAAIAAAQQEPVRATWLLGAANSLRQIENTTNPLGREDPFWAEAQEAARLALGEAAYHTAFAAGTRMTPLQALLSSEPALLFSTPDLSTGEDDLGSSQASVASPASPSKILLPYGEHLTRREADVLRLLAEGLTNAEIADRLALSVVTVNSYLRSIYSKLGVSSRTRAARIAMDNHLI